MTLERRLDRLEQQLSPTELVNRWLDEAFAAESMEGYARTTLDLPADDQPINRLCREAHEGVAGRFGSRRGDDYQQALRGALRQTVFRFELVLRANEQVHSVEERAFLLTTIFAAWLAMAASDRRPARRRDPHVPEVRLDHTREAAIRSADDQLALAEAVKHVEARYFDGHSILFPAIAENFARQTRGSQEIAVMADRLAELDGLLPFTPPSDEEVERSIAAKVADLVEPARSSALDKLGEDERAIGIAIAWLRPKLALPASVSIGDAYSGA
jgi:hypothetical protein